LEKRQKEEKESFEEEKLKGHWKLYFVNLHQS
jgi:hypothetical protein